MTQQKYRVGDTFTITQEMEDAAAAEDVYVVVHGGEGKPGPPLATFEGALGRLEAEVKAKELSAAFPQYTFEVLRFTVSPFTIPRAES